MEKSETYSKREGRAYDDFNQIPGELVWKKENGNSKEIIQSIKKVYNTPGVWVMFGLKDKIWKCLQVAQRHSSREFIGEEIACDIEMMFLEEPLECKACNNRVSEDRAFYTDVYDRQLCEKCDKYDLVKNRFCAKRRLRNIKNIISLSRRFDMYHAIFDEYDDIVIKQIMNDGNKKEIQKKERDFAEEHLAIYYQDIKYYKKIARYCFDKG
ncbi:hypothetical protein [Lacrimispora amygdalina]|uniref:hypothetical protein n=1 Tax=Lacrimispora amygdalina TaxID=253257 RepID=UPI000BE2E426|nr:hypothetical protein [Lacrimispora amygdalina]